MVTMFIAWVNGKYKCDYDGLFLGSVIVDVSICIMMSSVFN